MSLLSDTNYSPQRIYALLRLLEAQDGLEVAAGCGDLDSLFAVVDAERPDVVVTDIRMPPGNNDEGIQAAIRLRETVFWTNRDGFGSTSSFDFDHLLSRVLLFRWGSVGTVSEETEGLDWRSALVLYHNLRGHRAIAYETFVRGETEWVELKEYGARAIYRQSLLGRPWLYGELVTGYSWPRLDPEDERQGSFSIGVGLELHFGRDLR